MLLHGKQRSLLDKLVQHTVAKLIDRMERRTGRFAGRGTVLLSKERKLVKLFRLEVAAVRVKKATGRKACEIFLAGFQQIRPHNAHGFVRPLKRPGVTLPQHVMCVSFRNYSFTIQPN